MDNRVKSLIRGAIFGLIGAASVAAAATFNLFQPATGLLVGNASTYVTTAAVWSNIQALLSGTCNSGTLVHGDGSCSAGSAGTVTSVGFSDASSTPIYTIGATPVTTSGTITQTLISQAAHAVFIGPTSSTAQPTFRALIASDLPSTAVSPGSYTATNLTVDAQGRITAATNGSGTGCSAANPTGVVGLTAVNGVSTSCPRSDSSPSLSQSIAPTWTGAHLFAGAPVTAVATGGVSLGFFGGSAPLISWVSSGATANNRLWFAAVDGVGDFIVETSDDAVSTQKVAIEATRTASAVATVQIGNATDEPTLNLFNTVINQNTTTTAARALYFLNADTSHEAALVAGNTAEVCVSANPTGGAGACNMPPLAYGIASSAILTLYGTTSVTVHGLTTFNAGTHGAVAQMTLALLASGSTVNACNGGCSSTSVVRNATGNFTITHNIGTTLSWTCATSTSAGNGPMFVQQTATGSTTMNVSTYNVAGSLTDPASGTLVNCIAQFPG